MADVIEPLKDADMVVFASPIYWFDITAQEKAAIDRLYAFGATGFPFTKTALLLDSHSEGVYDAAIAMYKSTCAYCKWEDQGIVTISGMTERDSMVSSPKLKEVRELGLASSPKDKKNGMAISVGGKPTSLTKRITDCHALMLPRTFRRAKTPSRSRIP